MGNTEMFILNLLYIFLVVGVTAIWGLYLIEGLRQNFWRGVLILLIPFAPFGLLGYLFTDGTINEDGYVNLLLTQEVSSATAETQFGAPVISTRRSLRSIILPPRRSWR